MSSSSRDSKLTLVEVRYPFVGRLVPLFTRCGQFTNSPASAAGRGVAVIFHDWRRVRVYVESYFGIWVFEKIGVRWVSELGFDRATESDGFVAGSWFRGVCSWTQSSLFEVGVFQVGCDTDLDDSV